MTNGSEAMEMHDAWLEGSAFGQTVMPSRHVKPGPCLSMCVVGA